MRHIFNAVVLALLLPSAVMAQEVTPTQAAQTWAKTFDANDAKNLAGFYHESETMVVVASSGKLISGYQAMSDEYEAAFEQVRFFDSGISELKTQAFGEAAHVTFRHAFSFELAQDKSKWRRTVRTTLMLIKQDGKWLIANEHSSPILGVEYVVRIEEKKAAAKKDE